MKEGFRQSMAWLHTWVGLLVGWLLFFVYLTGTLGYVDTEIDHWMMPEKPFFASPGSIAEQVQLAQTVLQREAADAEFWGIEFIVGRDANSLDISWQLVPEKAGVLGESFSQTLDPTTGLVIDNTIRETGGGDLLYHMHYRLHYMPLEWAYYIIGVCSMFMFVAMISGIIVHRKIFKDFFTFRPGKGQRSWLDGHNVLSVTSLPFHLMITYTGFLFFLYTFLPFPSDVIYGNDNNDFGSFYGGMLSSYYTNVEEGPSEITTQSFSQAEMLPFSSLLGKANAIWGEGNITSMEINHPGRSNARITFHPNPSDTLAWPVNQHALTFDGISGELIEDTHDNTKHPIINTYEVLVGLHRGLFASPGLRILYVLVSIAGTAMIGTGLLLWSNKRKSKMTKENKDQGSPQSHFGLAVVDRLNLGTIIGMPIAIAAYFLANHLVPVQMSGRQDWEVHAMYLTMMVMFIYPIWRPLNRARIEMLWFAAGAYFLIPIVNFFTTQRHLGVSLFEGDWIMAGFDITALVCGIVFVVFAVKVQQVQTNLDSSKIAINNSSGEVSVS